MMTRRMVLFLAFCVTAACGTTAHYADRGPERFNLEYQYEDVPQEKKILLHFRNTRKHAVCLGPENWPQNGILLNSGNEVFVEVAGQRFFLDIEQDFCPRCNKKVLAGEEIQGFFNYTSFELPKQVEPMEKKLVFDPVGFSCR